MRIAIVNDLRMAVEILRRVIAGVPEYEVAWVAYDGAEAVQKCLQDTPDLVLMDLIMPKMDGVEATRQIMQQCPCTVLVVTATVGGNASKVFEAMGYGALDAVNTPAIGTGGDLKGGSDLLVKIARLGRLLDRPVAGPKEKIPLGKKALSAVRVPLLTVVGSSTGGPKALAQLLSHLPSDLKTAILIVQHVDQQFAPGMASWLGTQSALPVALAAENSRPEPGRILLAGTNDHLVLTPDLKLHYTPEPKDYPYRPSVNVFFKSVAQYWPERGLAVLLTGMGQDGAEGMLALRKAGWRTVAQNRESCVVYGMPKAAADLGAVDRFLSPDDIGKMLRDQMNRNPPDKG